MAYSLRLMHLLIPGIIAFVLFGLVPSTDDAFAKAAAASPSSLAVPHLILPPQSHNHATRAEVDASVVTLPNAKSNHWVDTWASMPQLTEPQNLPPAPFNATNLVFSNTTLRQTIRLTALPYGGGDDTLIRIRISNAFGGSDLGIASVSVALPFNGSAGVSAIEDGTVKKVTFTGDASVTIPIGALVVSDPIRLSGGRGKTLKPGVVLTVTIYTEGGQASNAVTSHPGSRTTSWFVKGNYVDAVNLPTSGVEGEAKMGVAHWYWLSAVEVWAPKAHNALVIIGDSITDGRGSTDNANNRWPDLLFNRVQTSRRPSSSLSSLSFINQAAGGNRILNDGLGPSALSRIERDVLSHSSVTHALLFIGVNDIGTSATSPSTQTALTARLVWSYKQMATRLKAQGLVVVAATITPFSGPGQSYSDANREDTRRKVNTWMKGEGVRGGWFDAVVDFDKILADPAKPDQLAEAYNGGDYLHPNGVGYQALADKFPLEAFDL